jgi:phage tail-like protein
MPEAPSIPGLPAMPPLPQPPAMPTSIPGSAVANNAAKAASSAAGAKNGKNLNDPAVSIRFHLSVEALPKYTNIKLSRPINEESHLVATWFMEVAQVVKRGTNASITAVDGSNKVIAKWELADIVPVRWTGPSFNIESPKMAMETLEIAYHGFLKGAAKGA